MKSAVLALPLLTQGLACPRRAAASEPWQDLHPPPSSWWTGDISRYKNKPHPKQFFISCTRRQVNLQLYLLEAMLEAMVVLIEMLLCLASMVVNLVIAISIRFISFYGTKPLPTVSTSLHYHINIAWCIFQLIIFSFAKQRRKNCLDLNTKITL